jgi:DNA-binding transcriptional ArsR family regulator
MPLADQPEHQVEGHPLEVRVAPSAAVELYWATVLEPDGRNRVQHPSLAPLEARPQLRARLVGLWAGFEGAESPAEHHHVPELLVLADRAGALLETDLGAMQAAATAAAASAVAPPPLTSETEGERLLIGRRLAILAGNEEQRQAWTAVLADVIEVLRLHWDEVGLGVSRRAARARSSQLPWADESRAVLSWARRDYGGLLPELLRDAGRRGRPVLVVPSYWSGRGIMFDLYDRLLLGIPAHPGATESRARTEPVSRVLKAMADPTRLAMLDHLSSRPRTVGELANDFGLAQPTTSRHVRILRDAGLVQEERQGGASLLAVDRAAVSRLVRGVGALLGADPIGADRLRS